GDRGSRRRRRGAGVLEAGPAPRDGVQRRRRRLPAPTLAAVTVDDGRVRSGAGPGDRRPVPRRHRAAAAVGRGTRGRVPRPGAHIRASGITTARPSTSPAFTASYASIARLSGYSVVCEAISPRAA